MPAPIITRSIPSRRSGSETSLQPELLHPETWTNDRSLTFAPPTSPDTRSVTSSPGLADGPTPSDRPDGRRSRRLDRVLSLSAVLTCGQAKRLRDERHLWPVFRDLIAERRPATVFGEQVASATEWLGLVRSDLEKMGLRHGGNAYPSRERGCGPPSGPILVRGKGHGQRRRRGITRTAGTARTCR